MRILDLGVGVVRETTLHFLAPQLQDQKAPKRYYTLLEIHVEKRSEASPVKIMEVGSSL